ncbi:transporter substrate-binding domain-containing protein [Desulfovibrio oxyclinae]|jgi:polar amino acid transport system substrate-binding protein|uniref:transporter substrate-binding domain-containing protein n=1 Tax=Desulfovibrio oxyclinae TaxID=63560 RepID=UPI0003688549|nr:transporter substrate-binding domain-containing protein [Desulfovibrio oxyclinae]
MRVFKIMALSAAMLLVAASMVFAGPTYDRVMGEKVVRAGISNKGKPFGFINAQNEWVGFDMDMAKEIAKRIGAKLEPVVVNNKTRISFVQTNPPKVDMVLSNMTHKRVRDEKIDFSITYFFDGQKFLAPKGMINKPEDLVGKKIGSMQGTTSIVNVKKYLRSMGDNNPKVIGYQNEVEMFEALRSGRVQAISTDSTLLIALASKMPGKFELVGEFISDEPYGVGLPEDDSAWRDLVNFTIQDIWADGTYMKIYNKWFGPDSDTPFPMTSKIEMWP